MSSVGLSQKRRQPKIENRIEATTIGRHKVNPYVFVFLTVTVVLLFLAPIPIALFKVLSVPWTLVLLLGSEILFTIFFAGTFHLNLDMLLIMSIAYGGLMWSSISN